MSDTPEPRHMPFSYDVLTVRLKHFRKRPKRLFRQAVRLCVYRARRNLGDYHTSSGDSCCGVCSRDVQVAHGYVHAAVAYGNPL